jgi:hypothetical protein
VSDYLIRYAAAHATKKQFFEKPFVWGETDCLQMAAFCLKQLGHEEPTASVRPYTDEKSALRALARAGHRSMVDAVDAYGLARIAPAMAAIGDIVAYEAEGFGGFGLGVAIGDGKFLGCANDIIDAAPTWVLTHAWRSI